jgi:hypothetical protein
MADFKAYASRRLKQKLNEPAQLKRWTEHGSTRYLWSEEAVRDEIHYVLHGQGEALGVFPLPEANA